MWQMLPVRLCWRTRPSHRPQDQPRCRILHPPPPPDVEQVLLFILNTSEQVFLSLRVGRFWYLPRRCGTCCRPHCQKEKSCPTVPAKRNHKGTQRRCCWWRWMIMVTPVWPGRHWETALLVLLVWRQTHPDQVAVAPGVPLLKSRALKINKTDGKS